MTMFGGRDSKEDHREKDHSEAVIDPALRSLASSPIPDKKNDSSVVNHPPTSDHPSSMPLRVEQFQMSSPFVSPALCSETRLFNVSTFDRRRHFDTIANTNSSNGNSNPHRLPSPPPPITTMSTSTATDNSHSHSPSPSVSVDRSSNSTPHIRRSPPQSQSQMPPAMYSTYQHESPMIPSRGQQQHHSYSNSSRQEPISHGAYIYPPNSGFDHHQPRYEHHPPPPPAPHHHQQQHTQHHHQPQHHPQHHPHHDQRVYPASSGLPVPFPHHVSSVQHQHQHQQHQQMAYDSRQGYAMPGGGGQPPVTIVHTDDAATKLTDGIRRRCFNCCTTDTSTWRRSNLSPGKVLCNKCGLFERTHSRPRPDQFPHKRGPLATSTLRGRTPPGANQLPPIAHGGGYHQYHHQNITPLNTGGLGGVGGPVGGGAGEYGGPGGGGGGTTLPGLGAWHGNSSATSSGSNGNGASGAGNGSNGNGNSSNSGSAAGGGENTNGTSSAAGTPLLPPSRRSTLDSQSQSQGHSPRLLHNASPRDRHFDDAAAADGRHPPSPPSRSSTAGGANTGTGPTGSASHTPPPGSTRESAA
ncbi:hypothetical protein CVT25_013015 [Psilocybe cyanescens]|uniref:GATA-type domain-containing protein n=1 Tax=Psilocybe cyanescens TaxID=93625 RepID=A0A409XLS9_PSICY|nr:hypothetical protein CVT25_013015 [Psilocybe cyanescens]